MSDEQRGDAKTIRWRRLTAEGAAIVISILLAFCIDAGWDSRQERVEEQTHLAALHTEFAAAREMIQAELAQISDAASAVRLLLALDAEQATRVESDSLAGLFVQILSIGRVNLPSGALQALIAAGDLRLIRDRNLASQLASWAALTAEAHENAGWLVEHRDRALAPFLNQYVGGLWTAGRSGLLDGYPPTRFPPQTELLFSDPHLEGHLSYVAVRLALLRARYGAISEAADAITGLIEQRMEG